MRYQCPACRGRGWCVVSDHDPNCDMDYETGMCSYTCPIEVQQACSACQSSGKVSYDWMVELINALDVTPMEKAEIIDQIVTEAEKPLTAGETPGILD